MLYALEGKVIEKQNVRIYLDVNGVVFDVLVGPRFSEELDIGSSAKIFVAMITTDEEVMIYGFKTSEEREVFKNLIKLKGIGPNVVFRIMSALELDELLACLETGNIERLSGVKGVGPKRAERIIFEAQGLSGTLKSRKMEGTTRAKAISALVTLGLKEAEAAKLVDQSIKKLGKLAQVEEVIKIALGGNIEDN